MIATNKKSGGKTMSENQTKNQEVELDMNQLMKIRREKLNT